MIRYLICRPISVFMAFLALVILGVITYFHIPTSLLPDIAIPEITVQIKGGNLSARELEQTVVGSLRSQLMQTSHLRDIRSETQDKSAVIRLFFEYGTRTDLSFIEVNEKVDGIMASLPRDMERPRVVKASVTDIPVFDLNLTLSKDSSFEKTDEAAFIQMSDLAQNIIKRRLEQLPEVAMVDITGVQNKHLSIVPDPGRMKVLGLQIEDLEKALSNNNIETSSAVVKEGYYEYNIKFSTSLRTPEDVEKIYLKVGDHVMQLKDIAKVSIASNKEKGTSYYNGKRAIVLSVVKQSNVKMENLQKATADAMASLRQQYPEIDFAVTGDQTNLLDITIGNLKQDLVIGFILICIVAVIFLRDMRMPLIIGISLLVSLMISMLLLYLFNISLNIISISGLILSVGMMIDSAIIVTDNITQFRKNGISIDEACVRGTNEVITPMLSSILTTISVFLPLIFLSGIAGAIFYDQAVSITLSLFVSYFTGIIFLPVLYKLAFSPRFTLKKRLVIIPETSHDRLMEWYDRGIKFTFSHKTLVCVLAFITLPLCVFLFYEIKKDKMPDVQYHETVAKVDWNESITIDENTSRTNKLLKQLKGRAEESTSLIGQQQYLISRDRSMTNSESKIYLRAKDTESLDELKEAVAFFFNKEYPTAVFKLNPPETVFEALFDTSIPDIIIELYPKNGHVDMGKDSIDRFKKRMVEKTGENITTQAYSSQINITVDREQLMLYNVELDKVISTLKSAFGENSIAMLRSYSQYTPIMVDGEEKTIDDVIANTLIYGGGERSYPLKTFVKLSNSSDVKEIVAGRNGEYKPLYIAKVADEKKSETIISNTLKTQNEWNFDLSGSLFQNREMINQLMVVLFVSLLMMYFILTAQFESFLQPLILLIEIPIDIAAALLLLMLCGHTLNLMSAIGIVVTCGIIINDSILKIDVINELRKAGVPLMEAIHQAGKKRLRAILMTSLTSMLALVPFLFSNDLGSELQRPLSIAMIGAMVVGTIVSLFLIPLIYWFIYQKEETKKVANDDGGAGDINSKKEE